MGSHLFLDETSGVVTMVLKELPWQWPAATEQFYFSNHCFRQSYLLGQDLYIAIPWATLIDREFSSPKTLNEFGDFHLYHDLKRLIQQSHKRTHTICQHILWRNLVPIWEDLGITDVYLSHFEKNLAVSSPINFHSWPLMAPNFENISRQQGLIVKSLSEKKYLASFIGGHSEHYRSEIRCDLKNMTAKWNRPDVIFELYSSWFYEPMVYDHQVWGKDLSQHQLLDIDRRTETYNQVLSNSVFSFCPEGSGPNTLRLWESLAVGTIPVIYSDDWIPPKISGLNWEEFAVFIPQSNYRATPDILQSFNPERIEKMKHNCLNAYHHLSKLRCF